MRITVTGATGMLGSKLVEALLERGDDVTVLSRDAPRAAALFDDRATAFEWRDPKVEPAPEAALQGADAVVHLLGERVDQRWTDSARREIRDSRVLSTRNLVEGIARVSREHPDRVRGGGAPKVLVSQSATGVYGPRGDEPIDESAAPGEDFLARVCADWEAEAAGACDLGLRVVTTRTGVVLSESGGALARMLPPFKLGAGGPVAGGAQYVPWIHSDDVVGGLLCCLDSSRAAGPVNLVAPTPVTNRELSKALGRVLHRPALTPVPAFALKLLYGDMAQIVTTGVRAVPRRLQELGYRFHRPDLEPALRHATGRS